MKGKEKYSVPGRLERLDEAPLRVPRLPPRPASPLRPVGLALMVLLLLSAGVMHFVRADLFVRIVPPAVPWPLAAVYVSGAAELLLGLGLLIPRVSGWAALGAAALFVAVFPANVYHWLADVQVGGGAASGWYHAFRLPAQGLLIAWALWLYRSAPRATASIQPG